MGKVAVRFDDGSSAELSPSIRQLLAILIATGPEGATSEQLADELWGEVLPTRWRPSLRMAVTRLRSAIGSESVVQADSGYRLDVAVDVVDAWWLDSLATDESQPVSEPDVRRALAGVPYAGVDSRALVARAGDLARAQQAEVTVRFCRSAETMSASTGAALVANHPGDQLDERVSMSIGRALARSGLVGQAAGYLDEVAAAFDAELDFVPAELIELQRELPELAAAESNESMKSALPVGLEIRPKPVPPALEHLLDHGCYGREDEIERLFDGRSNVLVGPSGSGKTRLLAHVAAQALQRGDVVTYVGAAPVETPYGPFVAALEELRKVLVDDDVAGNRGREETHRATEAARWVAVHEHLEQVAGDRRHWVLIDDVQAFDSASKRMVAYLTRASTQRSLVFVVCGRSDQADDEWVRMRSELQQLGFGEVDVASLGPEALAELIKSVFPDTSLQARSELAQELLVRNAGLPAVARSLLNAVDPETMTLDVRIESYDPQQWSQPASGLDPEVVAVAVAAAVIGLSFSVGEVIELLDLPENEVTGALEALWFSDRVVDGIEPDQLQFSHALVRDAFLRAAPGFKLAALHQRAAELTDDLHAKARHQAAAVPTVDAEVAARSLIASANQHMASGSWRDALVRLRDADLLLEDGLDVDSLIMMATALDYSGMSGKGPRRRAFDLAVADGRFWVAGATGLFSYGTAFDQRSANTAAAYTTLRSLAVEQGFVWGLSSDGHLVRTGGGLAPATFPQNLQNGETLVGVAGRLFVFGETGVDVLEISGINLIEHVGRFTPGDGSWASSSVVLADGMFKLGGARGAVLRINRTGAAFEELFSSPDSLPTGNVRSIALRTTSGELGSGGHWSSTIMMSAPSSCWTRTASSGVNRTVDPSYVLLNVTPSSSTFGSSENTWNPPESVSVRPPHPANLASPPNPAISSDPGLSMRW